MVSEWGISITLLFIAQCFYYVSRRCNLSWSCLLLYDEANNFPWNWARRIMQWLLLCWLIKFASAAIENRRHDSLLFGLAPSICNFNLKLFKFQMAVIKVIIKSLQMSQFLRNRTSYCIDQQTWPHQKILRSRICQNKFIVLSFDCQGVGAIKKFTEWKAKSMSRVKL
jgi:hypothetical protein